MSDSLENQRENLSGLAASLQDRLPALFDLAIAEAKRADDPFGCVLADARTGEVILSAGNSAGGDSTAHAEINALRLLAETGREAADIALISTAEPCPLCASGIWWAGIQTVVFGTTIDQLIQFGWRQLQIPAREVFARGVPSRAIALVGGYEPTKCDALYQAGPRRIGAV